MQFEQIDVSTHSGFKADERPVSFIWRGRHYRIDAVIDRWYEGGIEAGAPALNYFKARTDTGSQYLLRYNSLFDAWAIALPDIQ
jgi:hypothetical protein